MPRPKPEPEQPEQPAQPEQEEQLAEAAVAPEPAPEPFSEEPVADEPVAEDESTAPEEAPVEEMNDPAEQRIAELESEVAGLKDQLLRALAEVENVRRRAQKERDDTRKYAAAPMLKDLLAVADNLSRAIEAAPEGEEIADQRTATLLDGIKLTQRELEAVFERHHIVKIDPLGKPLDPHRHEAMFEMPDPSQPSGTVVQVLQSGYLLHDRLLRAAQVGVAKGGPPASSGTGEPAPEEPETPDPGAHVDTSA